LACIEKIYSVSALVGSSECNANCSFCAAKDLKKEATTNNKMPSTFKSALKLSARYGGWSLSLTGSGEPTCSPEAVTNALLDYRDCARQGAYFPNVNLFTNGILLGDDDFCRKYLPEWKELGLTAIAVSLHSTDPKGQNEAYRINNYPDLKVIFDNIKKYELQCRATLLLRREIPESLGSIHDSYAFYMSLEALRRMGVENVTTWCIANPDGSYNYNSPTFWERMQIKRWLNKNAKLCHGHVWGGGVYDYRGMLVRYTDYVSKHNPKKDYVRQLVVFQDGLVAYSWIKEGALCMKM
jgi:sulfatase maturation enzyme AslB (radical SAM superfamily)